MADFDPNAYLADGPIEPGNIDLSNRNPSTEFDPSAYAGDESKPWLKLGPLTVQKSPTSINWLEVLKDEATKTPDTDARAMFQSMGGAGGLTRTAIAELLSRATGGKGVEWKRAAQGNAKTTSEYLKDAGADPITSAVLGLIGDVVSDPAAAFLGGSKGLVQKPQNIKLLNAFLQKTPGQLMETPLATGMRGIGKKIFQAPMKPADAEFYTKFPSSRGVESPSEYLWNKGDPMVGDITKGNIDLGNEITDLRKAKGAEIGKTYSDAGGGDLHDIAPEFTAREAAIEEQNAVAKKAIAEHEGKVASSKAALPKEQLSLADTIKQGLAGDKTQRAQALDLLAAHAPRFKKVIERNGKLLGNSQERDAVLGTFHDMIDDISEGPRSLEGLHELQTSYSKSAAGSTPMGTNQYARGAKQITQKQAHAGMASAISEELEKHVAEHLGNSSALPQLKQDYMKLRRGEKPIWSAIEKQEKRQPVSKLDMLATVLGGVGASHMSPGAAIATLLGGAAVKGAHETMRSPRLGMGLGAAIGRAGQGSIWDNLAKQAVINNEVKP